MIAPAYLSQATQKRNNEVNKRVSIKRSEYDLFRSTFLMDFVRQQDGVWNHQQWLDLLDELHAKDYEFNIESVGAALEQKKASYLARKISCV